MKIIIEASSIAQGSKTGVGYFAEQLAVAIERNKKPDLRVSYLWLNFLERRKSESTLLDQAQKEGRLIQKWWLAQKAYAKLVYAKIAPPLLVRADWVLFPNFYIWPLAGKSKRAVIVHDMCFLRFPEYVEDKNQRFLSSVALPSIDNANLIIANSQFTKNEIVDLTGVNEAKIVTIDIPVDSNQFLPSQDKGIEHLNNRYGVSKKYILTLGTIEPRKNIPLLVEAYCLLPDNLRQQYSLVIAGKWGWKTETTREAIERRQREGFDIITTGYIDDGDKCTLYRNASAYAISTFYEGFGMPLLEAMHCGIPTVATDIPVLREVAGESACLWSSFDAGDFSKQLSTVLTDTKLTESLSQSAIKQSGSFSWDITATRLLKRLD